MLPLDQFPKHSKADEVYIIIASVSFKEESVVVETNILYPIPLHSITINEFVLYVIIPFI